MSSQIEPFSDEQLRVSVNLRQEYEVWIDAERRLARLPYGMAWKTIAGKDYLYEISDRQGNGRSLGPRSEITEARHRDYRETKAVLKQRRDQSREVALRSGRVWRALRLPMAASEAAEILREADLRGMLGPQLLLIGTNAVLAYALEAGGMIRGLSAETRDFDIPGRRRSPWRPCAPCWTC